ncbi:MAG: MFS transporter [Armatimonadetes bacterium]|nr:MFS transporter [Armatimonadota bacterium]
MQPPSETHAKRWYEGVTGYHWLVLVVACFGWLFDTMDQWLYVFSRQPALRELLARQNIEPTDANVSYYSGIVQAIFIFGWATGGFLFGIIGDRLGRTRTMAITVLMYAGFTGLSGLSQTWQQFAVFRFLTGLGVGGEFAAGASLVAEVFPPHARATALGIMQASSAVGNILAGLINLTVAPTFGWRWVFAVGVFPALLVFVIRLFVKEPERWEQAKEQAIREHKQLGALSEMWHTPHLRRNLLVGVGLGAIGIIGFWGISTWSPDLLRNTLNPENLEALRPQVERQVSYAGMAQNAGAFFGSLFAAWLAQRVGRRFAIGVALLLCLIIAPATFHLTTSFATAMVFFPLMGFSMLALLGCYAVYVPEIFPTRLRATGTGFSYNVARYIAAIAPWTFGTLRAAYGIQWAATIISAVFLLGYVVLRWAPETKGKPLPE